jgi:hypothetical protein
LSSPGAITGGIAEALIATAFGLGIAITALLPFNFLNSRLDEARHEIESAAVGVWSRFWSMRQLHIGSFNDLVGVECGIEGGGLRLSDVTLLVSNANQLESEPSQYGSEDGLRNGSERHPPLVRRGLILLAGFIAWAWSVALYARRLDGDGDIAGPGLAQYWGLGGLFFGLLLWLLNASPATWGWWL